MDSRARSGGLTALLLLALGCAAFVLILERPALAFDIPVTEKQWSELLKDLRPAHMFAGFVAFAVLGVFGRYSQWSGFFVLAMALGALACAGVGITWGLMSGVQSPKTAGALSRASEEADSALERFQTRTGSQPRPAAFVPPQNVGDACQNTGQCPGSSVCAEVGSAKRCWLPCHGEGACQEGQVCQNARQTGLRVCVKP